MSGNEPATKQDLTDLKQELHTDMGQFRSELRTDMEQFRSELRTDMEQLRSELRTDMEQLRSEMNHSYRDVVERLDEIGTKMLTAFYNVAETHGKRLSDLDSSDSALRSRLSTVEKRLMEIEKRLNFPPAA